MSPLDLDEQGLTKAFHQTELEPPPDVDRLVTVARIRGRRTRRGRRAVAGAAVAVLVGTGGTALLQDRADHESAGLPITTTTGHPSKAPGPRTGYHRTRDHHASQSLTTPQLATAYAVLEADGWTAPAGQPFREDEKLYYAHGDESVSLNWRPPSDDPSKFGAVVGSATIDGAAAEIRKEADVLTVVGPVSEGRMLTLSASPGMGMDELRTLAAQVHRQ